MTHDMLTLRDAIDRQRDELGRHTVVFSRSREAMAPLRQRLIALGHPTEMVTGMFLKDECEINFFDSVLAAIVEAAYRTVARCGPEGAKSDIDVLPDFVEHLLKAIDGDSIEALIRLGGSRDKVDRFAFEEFESWRGAR